MDTTMSMEAALVGRTVLRRKNSGTPTSAPPPKQISCLRVRLNRNLGFTRARSLGTAT